MKHSTILLLVLLWPIALEAANIFDYKTFSVYSKVTYLDVKGPTFFSRVHERYSPDQFRAVISLKSHGGRQLLASAKSATYYLDRKFNTSLLWDESDMKCRLLEPKEFLGIIHIDKLVTDYSANDLVLGPYRLVLFLYQFQSSFKLLKKSSIGNNLQSMIYEYQHDYRELGTVTFRMYFPDSMQSLDENSVPLRIRLYLGEKYLASYEFSQYKFDDEVKSLVDIPKQFNDFAIHDPFVTKPIAGCSGAIAYKSANPFAVPADRRVQFSFRAEVWYSHTKSKGNMFVAYDSGLGTMRIDFDHSQWDISKIISFNLNRVYHIARKKSTRDFFKGDMITNRLRYPPCVVAKLLPDSTPKLSNLDIGRLLAGSDNFVYMGRAEVRGIQVSVYESFDSSIPFWRDQFITYQSENNSSEIRMPDVGVDRKNPIVHQTLIYMADSAGTSASLPVMIEIFKLNEALSIVYHKHTIFLRDFSWTLSNQAPNGMRLTDYFSLKDHCSIGEDLHGEVEVVLRAEGPGSQIANATVSSDSFAVSEMRNLDLMSEIQARLKLPATMIYDIESRLVARKDGNELLVTFRAAQHSPYTAKLVYLGKVRVERADSTTYSFVECFLTAAHRGAGVEFAFDPDLKLCYIESKIGSERDENASGELYQIQTITDRYQMEGSNWLRRMSHGQNLLKFQGEKFTFTGAGNVNSSQNKQQFSLQRIVVKPNDHEYAIASAQKDGDEVQVTKIPGFGLSEIDPKTRVVTGKRLDSENWKQATMSPISMETDMDYSQCQIACLRDVECKAFSVCVLHSGIKCVLADVKFDSLRVLEQIKSNSSEKLRPGQLLSVQLDDGETIQLEKQTNCAIHNKLFLDLFDLPTRARQVLKSRQSYAVQNREQCAEICFNETMHVLKSEQLANDLPYLNDNIDLSQNRISELLSAHQSATRQVCREFFYWTYEEIMQLTESARQEFLTQQLKQELPSQDTGGYCIMSSSRSALKQELATKDPQYVLLEKFSFKFEYLFEKKFGVALKASAKSVEEANAYSEVNLWSKEASEQTLITLRSFIERGDNFQETITADAHKCAMVCFLQSWAPWPVCRSFEVRIEEQDDRSVVICALNSITLKQAINLHRFDLIEEAKEGQQVWHYDPHPGFVSNDMAAKGSWQILELDSILRSRANLGGVRIHVFGAMVIIIVSMSCGLFLGVKLAGLIITKLRKGESPPVDRENLVISFENLVSSDMEIT